jgi:phospholipid-transporting ATPase
LAQSSGEMKTEQPNNHLYKLDQTSMTVKINSIDDNEDRSINNCVLEADSLLLRGSSIRATTAVLGLVIYTGHETRIMMNNVKS